LPAIPQRSSPPTISARLEASPDVFLLAVTREQICIGIACAGIVLAGTDLGASFGSWSHLRIARDHGSI
jgi:hypothetical protein